ncbi:MAG: hypothetical protein EOO08_05595 [Chitinophagaceae bacterium]|nr:MAG: hypothetical protein EOO08_05595 [Chitinophagaceae bacterium]
MATITNTPKSYVRQTVQTTFVAQQPVTAMGRFMNWCANQEQYRFGWLAAVIAIHGCALTPITLFAIILSGSSIALWATALVAMCAALVSNLAAQPTKVTIPIFFVSILVDVAIIVACLMHGFNIAGTYI